MMNLMDLRNALETTATGEKVLRTVAKGRVSEFEEFEYFSSLNDVKDIEFTYEVFQKVENDKWELVEAYLIYPASGVKEVDFFSWEGTTENLFNTLKAEAHLASFYVRTIK